MPDSFFATQKSKKRKRADGSHAPVTAAKGRTKNGVVKAKTTKSNNKVKTKSTSTKTKRRLRDDEELSDDSEEQENWGGIDEMDLRPEEPDPGASGDEDEEETPAAKRLRLAKMYLDNVKESLADGEYDAAEIDKEIISTRLKRDVLEHSGKVHLFVADSYNYSSPPILRTRGHRFSVTSALATESGKYLFTSGKEGHIVKWDLLTGKKLATFYKQRPDPATNDKGKGKGKGKATEHSDDVKGHTDEILALAVSSDGKYLVSGGKDRRLVVWDAEKAEWIKTFRGPMHHRDTISALSFRKATYQLFTASFDRTLKAYDLTPSVMGYVETLFGHQDYILGLDSLRGDNCVSVGGRDKTVRYWKIVEETQLVFRGGGRSKIREMLEGGLRADEDGDDEEGDTARKKQEMDFLEGSLECIAMVDETTFVSGGDSGSICLWSTQKKKPVFTQPLAHGLNEVQSSTEGVVRTPRWVTAIAAMRYSDLFVSGSWEGEIRLWKLDPKLKSFSLVSSIPVAGVINSLQILSPSKQFFNENADSSPWLPPQPAHNTVNGTERSPAGGANPALLVVGVGQEHRFGRWLTVKEGGAVNGAYTIALFPRTLS